MSSFTIRGAHSELAIAAFVLATLVLGVWLEPSTQPFTPARSAVVLTRLPARSLPLENAQISAEERLARARAEIELSRQDGDPRHLGRAEGLLAPLLEAATIPPAARLLHATILQARHAFEPALDVVAALLEQQPHDAQAWLLRASITTVLGRVDEALHACSELRNIPKSIQIACRAQALALTGNAERALDELAAALRREQDSRTKAWLLSLQGELLYWYRSDAKAAQAALAEALALAPRDRYTRGLYADVALDRGDRSAALAAVAHHLEDDALLLRAMLAERGERRGALARELDGRFRASRERGDGVHQREEARFRLAEGDAKAALALAEEGFRVQRELWDARVLIEAANAHGDEDALARVRSWLSRVGARSPRLDALLAAGRTP